MHIHFYLLYHHLEDSHLGKKSIHCFHPDLPRVPICPRRSVEYAGAHTAADYEEIWPWPHSHNSWWLTHHWNWGWTLHSVILLIGMTYWLQGCVVMGWQLSFNAIFFSDESKTFKAIYRKGLAFFFPVPATSCLNRKLGWVISMLVLFKNI